MSVVFALVLVLVGLPSSLLLRAQYPSFQAPGSGDSSRTVYLFVGSDRDIERPDGDVQQTPYGRADIVLLVSLDESGAATALSVPRDLVAVGIGAPTRFAQTLQAGPQQLADAVCSTLGVGVDRYVEIDTAGFVAAIDALGGIDIALPYSLRDEAAGLALDSGPSIRVSGAQALALTRARHAEELRDGVWVQVDDMQGAEDRATRGAQVLAAVKDRMAEAGPVELARTAWATSSSLSIGGGLHPTEWRALATSAMDSHVLPVESTDGRLASTLGEPGRQLLEEIAFDTNCVLPATR